MDGDGACGCTSCLYHAVLQYLLHLDGHVGHILGNSLDSLHQAGWLKPVHTTAQKHEWKWKWKWNHSQSGGWGANTLLSHTGTFHVCHAGPRIYVASAKAQVKYN